MPCEPKSFKYQKHEEGSYPVTELPLNDQSDDEFRGFMARLREGDEQAANELFAEYAHRLVHLARSRMSRQLQQKVAAEDVLQSVFRSFYLRQNKGLVELANWEGLWGLLVRITLRKCGRNLEKFRAAKRDMRLEVSPNVETDESYRSWSGIAREPSPDEAVQLTETIEGLIRSIDDSDTRQILELRLQGCTISEISLEIGCTERTVHRKLGRIRNRLSEVLESTRIDAQSS